MKSELIKRFVKKTIWKVIVFTFLIIVFTSITQAMSPVITNEIALTQMQNSNEMFVLMDTYSKFRPVVNLIFAGVIVWFTYTIGRDVYKFVKTINPKNEKEN